MNRFCILFLSFVAFLSQIFASAYGQEIKKDKLKVLAGLDLIYDDNVWQYSKSDRELFKINGNTDPFFQKTEDLDDLIWEPYLYLSLQTQDRQTQIFAKLTGDFYTRNTSLNLGTYLIGLKRKIGDETSALISYTLRPREFLGISRERRGGTLVGETLTTHTTLLWLQRKIQNLEIELTGHYKFRNYNDAFDEQDADIYGVGLGSRIYSKYRLKTRVTYLFEQGITAGQNEPGFNNDLSYISHQFRIGPEVQIIRPLKIGFHYQLKYNEFTTNLTGDLNHYGRKDTTHILGLNAYYDLNRNIEAKLGFVSVIKKTNQFPDFFSYTENSATVGLSYLF